MDVPKKHLNLWPDHKVPMGWFFVYPGPDYGHIYFEFVTLTIGGHVDPKGRSWQVRNI